jgi:hypothetical protein
LPLPALPVAHHHDDANSKLPSHVGRFKFKLGSISWTAYLIDVGSRRAIVVGVQQPVVIDVCVTGVALQVTVRVSLVVSDSGASVTGVTGAITVNVLLSREGRQQCRVKLKLPPVSDGGRWQSASHSEAGR